jgi:protein-disulfide isomerase
MASRKQEREEAREEWRRQEAVEAVLKRRKRMVQLGFGGVMLAAIIVGVLIAVSQSGGGSSDSSGSSTLTSSSGGHQPKVAGAALVKKQLAGIPQRGNVLGDPSAKATIVEFGDPQCPVCKVFSEQVAPQLISGPVRKGTADYEFQPWLIIGPQSKPAARAAYAAGEQGKFWNYLELFYRNQGEENSGYVTGEFLTSIAKGAGVPDIAKWNTDRNSTKYDAQLAAISRQANQMGFSGTPTVYVQGPGGRKVISGVPNASQVEAALKSVS